MHAFEFESCVLNSLCKVLPNEAPASRPISRAEGLWGETVSFQLAFTTTDTRRDLSENALFVEVDSPLKDRIRMRSVLNVPVMTPVCGGADDDYLSTKAGMYPDLLREQPPFFTRAVCSQWRSLWFDISLEERLLLPEYPITLRVYSEKKELLASHSLTLNVIPAKLPPQKLIHTQWFHGDCLADYYGVEVFSERHWEIMEHFIREMGSHGINMILTPIFTPPLDTGVNRERTTIQLVDIFYENGAYRFDFSRLDRFVTLCLSCGIRYFEMAHLFTQWGARFAPKILVHENGRAHKKFGWHTPAVGEEYRGFLSSFLPALTGWLTRRGIAETTYFHISDEPSLEDLPSYRAAAEFALPFLKGFQTVDALSDYSFYETGCVKRPVPANDHIQKFLDNGVSGLWTYFCTAQYREVANRFIAMPSARNRILGVQLYLYRIEGFLQWGYNFYNTQNSLSILNPYFVTDGGGAFQAGDPYLVYPGPDGMPEESIRLMSTCEALFDLRALCLLEELRGREFTEALVYEDFDERITFSHYPRGERWLLHMRARVNEEIRRAVTGR